MLCPIRKDNPMQPCLATSEPRLNPMTTPRAAANRLNAAHSTGPRRFRSRPRQRGRPASHPVAGCGPAATQRRPGAVRAGCPDRGRRVRDSLSVSTQSRDRLQHERSRFRSRGARHQSGAQVPLLRHAVSRPIGAVEHRARKLYFACASPATTASTLSSIWFQPSS